MRMGLCVAVLVAVTTAGCVVNSNQSPHGAPTTPNAQPYPYPYPQPQPQPQPYPPHVQPAPGPAPAPAPAPHPMPRPAPTPNGGGGTPFPVPGPTPVIPVPGSNDSSWSLLERQQWDALSRDFTRNFLDDVNSHCGSRLDGFFVFDTFRHHFTSFPDRPLDDPTRDHAMAPFLAISHLCSPVGTNYELNKRAVNAKLRRIEVWWGGPSMGPSTVNVANGIVSVRINPADGVGEAQFQAFIEAELSRHI